MPTTYSKKQKLIACLTTICLVLVVGLSIAFIALHTEHTHTGADCPVCVELQAATQRLTALATACTFMQACLLLTLGRVVLCNHSRRHLPFATLIQLKVQLNN